MFQCAFSSCHKLFFWLVRNIWHACFSLYLSIYLLLPLFHTSTRSISQSLPVSRSLSLTHSLILSPCSGCTTLYPASILTRSTTASVSKATSQPVTSESVTTKPVTKATSHPVTSVSEITGPASLHPQTASSQATQSRGTTPVAIARPWCGERVGTERCGYSNSRSVHCECNKNCTNVSSESLGFFWLLFFSLVFHHWCLFLKIDCRVE